MVVKKIFLILFFLLLPIIVIPIICYSTNDIRVVNVKAQPGTVALTFDDGPSAHYTPQILAILKKYNIKATFFVVGDYVLVNHEVLKLVDADGHAIGNHTLTHPFLTKLSDQQLNKEIIKTQDIVFNVIKKHPVCVRYPYAATNTHVKTFIRSKGLTPIGINIDSQDYKKPGVQHMVNDVLSHVKSGSVILFHDGYRSRDQTVAALPLIIEGIQKKGLGFSQICVE